MLRITGKLRQWPRSEAVSRHHILPPIIYTPVPKPKKAENRPKTRRIQSKAAAASGDVGEAEETGEVSGFGAPAPTAAHPSQTPFTPIDGAERRIPSTTGNLSENTLKELLLAQEHDQQTAAGIGGTAPVAKE
jgi:hypothetical protein